MIYWAHLRHWKHGQTEVQSESFDDFMKKIKGMLDSEWMVDCMRKLSATEV